MFKEHDPVLDAVDTVIGDSKLSLGEVSVQSHVSYSTLSAWNMRKVKRPQFATVAAVVRSLGADISITYKGRSLKVEGDKK
jgi:hypothetical protein